MLSFLDYLDLPALQSAMAQTAGRQAAGNLAVQPAPALAPLTQAARQRAEAGRTLALGERRLGVEAQKLPVRRRQLELESGLLDLAARKEAFERRLEPFAYGVGALGVGTQVLGGIRQQEALKRHEASQGRTEKIAEQQLALQKTQGEERMRRYGALEAFIKRQGSFDEGPPR